MQEKIQKDVENKDHRFVQEEFLKNFNLSLMKWKSGFNSLEKIIGMPESIRFWYAVENLVETGVIMSVSDNETIREYGKKYLVEASTIILALGKEYKEVLKNSLSQIDQSAESVRNRVKELEDNFDEMFDIVNSALEEVDLVIPDSEGK